MVTNRKSKKTYMVYILVCNYQKKEDKRASARTHTRICIRIETFFLVNWDKKFKDTFFYVLNLWKKLQKYVIQELL